MEIDLLSKALTDCLKNGFLRRRIGMNDLKSDEQLRNFISTAQMKLILGMSIWPIFSCGSIVFRKEFFPKILDTIFIARE